ncbi:hypothetical protein ACFSB1_11785 [Halopseudomonas phragmitis]|uniref:DUF1449 domain-containing protein n=1 Tax=Halopseudomonas phragmitis TaxID=1931241 RepID=A0A1V0B075_9GAMM|nr:hypothetical protein [Halopseudomonas phragmitis]AQZ93343.1 hypothetical protein BVH74_00540 [Halopseudomonas phragmitis]
MELFFQTSMTFPVVLLSFVLCLAILYWLVVALGLLDIDLLDSASDGGLQAEGLGGLLLKLGLGGVPVTLLITLLVFFAWLFCYFAELLVLRFLPLGILRYPLGLVVLIAALMLAAPVVRVVIYPLRPLFQRLLANTTSSLLGRTVVVRSPRVTAMQGEALLEDGGAGLILRIRADESLGYKRGDRLVLLEYLEPEHAYRVITEDEFNGH